MKKGIIALLSVLAIAFAFVGCGSDVNMNSSSNSAAGELSTDGVAGLDSFPSVPALPES